MTLEENILLVIHYYYFLRNKTLDLLLYLKFNFDYMIFSVFEESSDRLKKLKEKDKRFFNSSEQIFEFKKLMMSYNKMAKNYLAGERLKRFFVLNSLDYFYKRLHKFIFEIKPVFLENKKYLKNYYVEFSKILLEMDIMKCYRKEIEENSQNYKLLKKLISAEDEEEVEEIGIDFCLEDNADELELAKESILFYSRAPGV